MPSFAAKWLVPRLPAFRARHPEIDVWLSTWWNFGDDEDISAFTDSEVDIIFEAPIELALAVTGFRHDAAEFDWGQPDFHPLDAPAGPRPGGLFARLFGRKG